MVLRCISSQCFQSTIFQKTGLILLLIVVQIGYGVYPVVVKVGIQQDNMSTFVFLFLKDITTLTLLVIVAMIVDGRKYLKWKRKDIIIFFGLGFTSVFSGPVLFFTGVYLTCPNAGALIQPTIPALTILFAFLWGMEKLAISKTTTCIKLLGTLFTVGGGVVAALAKNPYPPNESWAIILLGYTLLLSSIFSTSLYFLFLKKWIFNDDNVYPPMTTAACSYGMGLFCVSLIFIPYGILKPETFTTLTFEIVYPLIYATLSFALCFALTTYATSVTSPTLVTAFWPLQAIFTCASSWIVFGESPGPPQYVGFGLIVLGTVVVCSGKFSEQKENKDILINNISQGGDNHSIAKRSLLLGENEEIYDSGAKI